jgi:hypothetical protein
VAGVGAHATLAVHAALQQTVYLLHQGLRERFRENRELRVQQQHSKEELITIKTNS